MDYQEEQANELVVLEAIYGDEMTILSDDPHEFEIQVKYSDYEGHTTEAPPSVVISCVYTENYPEELPVINIEKYKNLPEEQVSGLKKHLYEEAGKSLGTVMVYTLITAAQEWLNDYEDNIKKLVALEKEAKAKIEADLERKKFEGTIVTKETFLEWKKNFDAERVGGVKIVEVIEKVKKLTGRELFLKDISLNESDLKFLEEDGEAVKYCESLYQDTKNIDINE